MTSQDLKIDYGPFPELGYKKVLLRMPSLQRFLHATVGTLFALLLIFAAIVIPLENDLQDKNWIAMGFWAGALLFIWTVLLPIFSRLELHHDRIRHINWRGKASSILFANISGFAIRTENRGKSSQAVLHLKSNNPTADDLQFDLIFQREHHLRQWLANNFLDLDNPAKSAGDPLKDTDS